MKLGPVDDLDIGYVSDKHWPDFLRKFPTAKHDLAKLIQARRYRQSIDEVMDANRRKLYWDTLEAYTRKLGVSDEVASEVVHELRGRALGNTVVLQDDLWSTYDANMMDKIDDFIRLNPRPSAE